MRTLYADLAGTHGSAEEVKSYGHRLIESNATARCATDNRTDDKRREPGYGIGRYTSPFGHEDLGVLSSTLIGMKGHDGDISRMSGRRFFTRGWQIVSAVAAADEHATDQGEGSYISLFTSPPYGRGAMSVLFDVMAKVLILVLQKCYSRKNSRIENPNGLS